MIRSVRALLEVRRPDRGARIDRLASVEDLRAAARRRLPAGVFDYVDGGAEDEGTLHDNAAAFRSVRLVPRVLRDVSRVDASSTILGRPVPMPLVLAPTGFTRIVHPLGELVVARAAGDHGVPYTLSTLATRSIEEVAAASTGPRWFQLYVWRDRALVRDLVDRAVASGYEALMVTVDTAVFGRRERDVRRGTTLPPKLGVRTAVDGLRHPRWLLDLVRSEPITFANLGGDAGRDGSTAVTLSDFVDAQFDGSFDWDDLAWVASLSRLPIVLKGIGSAADAKIACQAGVAAVVVSNHGGRQLDGAAPALDVLRDVVDEVTGEIEVLVDGGVRRGRDVVAACALGASGCLVGRPYLYGLAAAGEAGVTHLLDQFQAGVERTMALLGVTRIADLSPSALRPRTTGRHLEGAPLHE